MRILNENMDQKLDRITLYLTNSEAKELYNDLGKLFKNPKNNHTHLSSDDYQKEITICIYDPNDLNDFNERSKTLIKEDK